MRPDDLRVRLRAEAARVFPSDDALDAIYRRIERRGPARSPAATAALALGVAAVVIGVAMGAVVLVDRPGSGPIEIGPAGDATAPPSDDVEATLQPAAMQACSDLLGDGGSMAPPDAHPTVEAAYPVRAADLNAWWRRDEGDPSAPHPDGNLVPDDNGPVTICLIHADIIPAPGMPGQPDYQWELVAILADGTPRPLSASPTRPTDLPPPAEVTTDGGLDIGALLNEYATTTAPDGAAVLAATPADQGVPALHPPASTDATIDREAAEQAAISRLGDLDRYDVRVVFLADYESFPAGSATQNDPSTTRHLVWVVLVGPVEVTSAGPVGATPTTGSGIRLAIVDARSGTVIAVLERGAPAQ